MIPQYIEASKNIKNPPSKIPNPPTLQEQPLQSPLPDDPDMRRLVDIANLLDNKFRIPGTNIRFGLDALMGLIPYVGDLSGFVVSFFLLRIMARRGAGPLIMLRMMFNFVIDAAVGSIPFLGDLFDFGFKANRRNVELLKSYYATGVKRPSAGWSFFFLFLLFFGFLALLVWGTWMAAAWLLTQVSHLFM